MNTSKLREAQKDFIKDFDRLKNDRMRLYKLRDDFKNHFSIERLTSMDIDEYVIGKDNTTFCRQIERDLDGLGRITGALASKFGVYYGRTKADDNREFRHTKKWGTDSKGAYDNIRNAIIKLIQDGGSENVEALAKCKISHMFKGKILSTYYPDRYLNAFSDEHLKYFLKSFGLDTNESMRLDPVFKRELLLNFKNEDEVMKEWDVDMFAVFLYDYFPKRPLKKQKD